MVQIKADVANKELNAMEDLTVCWQPKLRQDYYSRNDASSTIGIGIQFLLYELEMLRKYAREMEKTT